MADFHKNLENAVKALEANKFPQALQIAQQLKEDPESILNETYNLVYYVIAVATFRQAVGAGNTDIKTIDKCISALEKSISIKPDHADSNMMMGEMYLVRAEQPGEESRHSYLAAKTWFEKASALGDPWPAEFCRPQLDLINTHLQEIKTSHT